jgi:cell fate (sporulation/competence/biofilm development) regulator YmcA (YheA/YmcA/DUF963 family)
MTNETKSYLDNFIKEFLDVKEVKQYLLLKKQIENSSEIKSLQDKVKYSQKDMALSLGTPKYEENKKKYLEAKEELENHPLIVNFNSIQEEVNYLLEELKNKLK